MKKIFALVPFTLCLILAGALIYGRNDTPKSASAESTEEKNQETLTISVNGRELCAVFENNSAVKALKEKLSEGEIVIEAHDYGGFEKVGELGFSLPHEDQRYTTEPGDLMLYQGDKVTLFYGSNSWSYTKLAHLTDISQTDLKELLGEGNATITLAMNQAESYTLKDIRNLQDFLLAKPTNENLSGKDYDVNNDGIWNVFDLCLMKRYYLAEYSESNNTDTRVKVTINGEVMYARINHTVTGEAFLEMLPYKVSGYRSTSDICCSITEELPNDSSQDEIWNIGEIGWFGGWFTILCDNEEQFTDRNRTIIGKFEDEYIPKVTALEGSFDITVELSE